MTDLGFAPKEVIPPQVCRLEVLAADKAETYGLQIGLKHKVIGGKHDGHTYRLRQPRREHRPDKAGLQSLVYLRGVFGPRLPQAAWRVLGEPRR